MVTISVWFISTSEWLPLVIFKFKRETWKSSFIEVTWVLLALKRACNLLVLCEAQSQARFPPLFLKYIYLSILQYPSLQIPNNNNICPVYLFIWLMVYAIGKAAGLPTLLHAIRTGPWLNTWVQKQIPTYTKKY